MLLISFAQGERTGIGLLDRQAGEVVDLAAAASELPPTMPAFIALGADGLEVARRALAGGDACLPASQVRLLAPMPRPPRNILCLGKNYMAHAREVQSLPSGGSGDGVPDVPIVFTKATSSVIGPGEPIPGWLDLTHTTDYEGELAVVIGPGGRGIPRADAMNHVYGYTIVNDVTARGLQRQHHQWFLGKSLDGFCPMGPAIATADDIPDVTQLRVQTRVNGELRQDACLDELIFDIPSLIETLSRTMTLEAGDVIATGTPAGVGMGFDPPRYLKHGDVVAVTIDPIGTLENPVECLPRGPESSSG